MITPLESRPLQEDKYAPISNTQKNYSRGTDNSALFSVERKRDHNEYQIQGCLFPQVRVLHYVHTVQMTILGKAFSPGSIYKDTGRKESDVYRANANGIRILHLPRSVVSLSPLTSTKISLVFSFPFPCYICMLSGKECMEM